MHSHPQKSEIGTIKLLKKYLYLYLVKHLFTMNAANFTELRTNLKEYLDEVENNVAKILAVIMISPYLLSLLSS